MSTRSIYKTIGDEIPIISMTDKCIVLDLDETLVSTQENVSDLTSLNILHDPKLLNLRKRTYYLTIDDLEEPGSGTIYKFWGVIRPHVEEFLIFCFSYFSKVIVWSAGTKPYVEAIVDRLFANIKYPDLVLTRNDIPKRTITKDLTKVFLQDRTATTSNTFCLDDNANTFTKNPWNAIKIPAYNPTPNIASLSSDDPTLLQIKQWLLKEEVRNASDVKMLKKDNIFTTPLEEYKNSNKDKYQFSMY